MNKEEPRQEDSDSLSLVVPDSLLRYLKSPAYKARSEFINKICDLPELGVGKLSLTQAADLVAVDMWGSGDIDVEIPDFKNEVLRHDDPFVLAALAPQRKMIVERLIYSVSKGSLKTSQTRRDLFTGAIDPESTIVDYDDLHTWGEEFGFQPGDWMGSYAHAEAKVRDDLAEALFDIRNIRSYPGGMNTNALVARQRALADIDLDDAVPEYANKTAQELREIIKGYAEEVAYLRNELKTVPSEGDGRVLRPKSRNTLYRLVVALCVAANIDPTGRGAAATIVALTQRVGLPIGDDTIRKVLNDLPEIGSD